ncbi:MAG: hypothetical protein JNK72_08020 [Myxococcales bacterium]|nr:hypothetical protein [Myxococcales bacterium]
MKVSSLRAILFATVVDFGCRRSSPPTPSQRPAQPVATPSVGAPSGSSQGAAPTPSASVDPPAEASAFRDTARFLPQGATVTGWAQSGSVRLFTGQELFQAIDGAGEKYVGYGFRQMARTDYRRPGSEVVVTAEVYDMATPLGAFGQYSMILSDGRDPSTLQPQARPIGGGGYLGTSQLVFWKGSHLVQINLADDAGNLDEEGLRALARETLPAFAERIAAALPGDTAAPAAPAGFPQDELVWGGTTYLYDRVLGVDNTGPGWIAHCRNASNKRYRVAFFRKSNTNDAHAVVNGLRGGVGQAVAGLGDEAFWLTHPSAGELLIARRGAVTLALAGPAGDAPTDGLDREGRTARMRALLAALPAQ